MMLYRAFSAYFAGVLLYLPLPVMSVPDSAGADAIVVQEETKEFGETGAYFPAERAKTESRSKLIYVPPRRGAPRARVGGGTRSVDSQVPQIVVVSPEHTGYTASAQPDLFWYVPEPVKTRFEFALIDDEKIDPVLELALDETLPRGIHHIDLADHDIHLEPGVSYQWSVALVLDSEQRSRDVVSTGRITWVQPDERQKARLKKATDLDVVAAYAGAGFWYDAFSTLSGLIDDNPQDSKLAEARAQLLEQVGLPEAAAYDRSRFGRIRTKAGEGSN